MGLFYRRTGTTNYTTAAFTPVAVGQTLAFEIAHFGDGNKRYDWWFRVTRAQPQDFVDYMRSYL